MRSDDRDPGDTRRRSNTSLPFDLDALERISRPAPRWSRWMRGERRAARRDDTTPVVTTPRASVALLALIPDPEQCTALRSAIAAAGAPYSLPPRLTLRNGLDMGSEDTWGDAVRGVTSRRPSFTVRLRPPEVIDGRMVCCAPVGDSVVDLQRALDNALSAVGMVAQPGDVAAPVLLLAGTFTGLVRSALHELANVVGASVRFPVEFEATIVYALAEAGGDGDVPLVGFRLGS
jgi:hypothetical protein